MYNQLEKLAILQLETLNKLLETKSDDYEIRKIVKEAIEDLEILGGHVRLIENNVLTLVQFDEMKPRSRL